MLSKLTPINFLAVIVLLLTINTVSADNRTNDDRFSVNYTVYYEGSDARVRVNLTSQYITGYMAVGFGYPGLGMYKSDCIFCWLDRYGTPQVLDTYNPVDQRFSQVYPSPIRDDSVLLSGGTQDVTLENFTRTDDGITTCIFSRKLDTGDNYDMKLVQGEEVAIMWAYHETALINANIDPFMQAEHSARGYYVERFNNSLKLQSLIALVFLLLAMVYFS